MSNTQLSDELIRRVRGAEVRAYHLAHEVGVHPSQLSAWLNRIVPCRADDPRVLRLAEVMGLEPAAAFEPWTPARQLAAAGLEYRGRR